jgi:hypothetical protein
MGAERTRMMLPRGFVLLLLGGFAGCCCGPTAAGQVERCGAADAARRGVTRRGGWKRGAEYRLRRLG